MREFRELLSPPAHRGWFPTAVVLDCDGVLLESAAIKSEAFGELFRTDWPHLVDRIVKLHEREGGLSRYVKFEMIFDGIIGEPLTNERKLELGAQYSELVLEKVLGCDVVQGTRSLLSRLSGRTHLYVASGTPQEELEITLEHHSLMRYFDEVWGSPTDKSVALQSAMSKVGGTGRDILFVGDAISDCEAARDAGVCFIGRVPPDQETPFDSDVETVGTLVELEDRLFGGS